MGSIIKMVVEVTALINTNPDIVYQIDKVKSKLLKLIIKNYKTTYKFSNQFDFPLQQAERLKYVNQISLDLINTLADKLGYEIEIKLKRKRQ